MQERLGTAGAWNVAFGFPFCTLWFLFRPSNDNEWPLCKVTTIRRRPLQCVKFTVSANLQNQSSERFYLPPVPLAIATISSP